MSLKLVNNIYTPILSRVASPLAIFGSLEWWHRASDLALSNNDPVNTWADTSGNGRTLTTGDSPVYLTT